MNKQDKLWLAHYQRVVQFVVDAQRLPSRHRIEDHRLLNWLKYNRKQAAAGKLSPWRQHLFDGLNTMFDNYKRLNQYSYSQPMPMLTEELTLDFQDE